MKGSLATMHAIGKRITSWATIGCSSHQPQPTLVGLKNDPCSAPAHAYKWLAPCNAKLTVSGDTEQAPFGQSSCNGHSTVVHILVFLSDRGQQRITV